MSALAPLILGVPCGPSPDELGAVVRGTTIVVTGASRGIGRATALRLAAVGAHVIGVARSSEDLTALPEMAAPLEGTCEALALDLRDTDAATKAAHQILSRWPAPMILISNAGHSIHRYLADYVERFHDIARTDGINYQGAVAFALPILNAMMGERHGHLIDVSSSSVDLPLPGWSAYTASKAAFDVWLDCVAPELAMSHVHATTIRLPRVVTSMSAPTAATYYGPQLSVDQAAAVICHAIVSRQRYVSPWWSRVVGVVRTAAPTSVFTAMTCALKRGVRP